MKPKKLLIVGAGITAATLSAKLKGSYQILIKECRNHPGGNCFDYEDQGTHIHQYGPHVYHSTDPRITEFLSQFTAWIPYKYTVEAEVIYHDKTMRVPFPYSRQTEEVLGKPLSESEVIKLFFKDYSEKMWGIPWEQLPPSIQARVPKNTHEKSEYFPGQFSALPKEGYHRMMEKMFDGTSIQLNTDPYDWNPNHFDIVVYTGRPDNLLVPGTKTTYSEGFGSLEFRSLDISFSKQYVWTSSSASLNICHSLSKHTRRTNYTKMTGGRSDLISTETPRDGTPDTAPYYPIQTQENQDHYKRLRKRIKTEYPNLILAGRLGSYKYLDMYQAVAQALSLSEKLLLLAQGEHVLHP